MKANELRIGNLAYKSIKSGQGRTIIDKIGCQDIVRIFENIGSFNYEPIELTAELALRLGFKRFESDGVVGFDTFEPEEKTIWYEIGKFTLVQWGENTEFYFSDNNLRIPVKYVHKLQNLYFEHTGVELQLSST